MNYDDVNEVRNEIMNHYQRQLFRGLKGAGQLIHAKSSVCSDRIDMELVVEKKIIKSICFEGDGCVISIAAADVICEILQGKNLDTALKIIEEYDKMLKSLDFSASIIEDLLLFKQISKKGSRVSCAVLVVPELKELLKNL